MKRYSRYTCGRCELLVICVRSNLERTPEDLVSLRAGIVTQDWDWDQSARIVTRDWDWNPKEEWHSEQEKKDLERRLDLRNFPYESLTNMKIAIQKKNRLTHEII